MSIKGRCHCGAVTFEVTLSDGINTARRCDCSLCLRRGAVAVSAPLDGLHILSGEDKLTLYQFNTRKAKHYFCSVCGIYTHHFRRSNPDQIGINLACLEGQTPLLADVIVNDGVNHPTDVGYSGIVGTLRFEPHSGEDIE